MSEVDHASNWDRLIFALEFVVNSEINIELTTSQCKYLLDKLTSLTDRIADLEAEHRWIPVSERLPEYDCTVLALLDDHTIIMCCYTTNGVGAFFDPDVRAVSDNFIEHPSHWMPLPPPPEDK